MRIARFAATGQEPRFGLVELEADGGSHPDTIAVIDADPLAGPVNYTGERLPLADVRRLAPRGKPGRLAGLIWSCLSGFTSFIAHAGGAILSRSPELFLERHGHTLASRPMKGTAPPGITMKDVYRAMYPFVGLQVLGLFLCIWFPDIALWLPRLAGFID